MIVIVAFVIVLVSQLLAFLFSFAPLSFVLCCFVPLLWCRGSLASGAGRWECLGLPVAFVTVLVSRLLAFLCPFVPLLLCSFLVVPWKPCFWGGSLGVSGPARGFVAVLVSRLLAFLCSFAPLSRCSFVACSFLVVPC